MENIKAKIDELGLALRKLHRHFLDNERQVTERRLGHKLGPLDFFNLLTQDESFRWLQPFSRLVTEIDAHPRGKIFSLEDILQAQMHVKSVLHNLDTPLGQRYAHYLDYDPGFLPFHDAVENLLISPAN